MWLLMESGIDVGDDELRRGIAQRDEPSLAAVVLMFEERQRSRVGMLNPCRVEETGVHKCVAVSPEFAQKPAKCFGRGRINLVRIVYQVGEIGDALEEEQVERFGLILGDRLQEQQSVFAIDRSILKVKIGREKEDWREISQEEPHEITAQQVAIALVTREDRFRLRTAAARQSYSGIYSLVR